MTPKPSGKKYGNTVVGNLSQMTSVLQTGVTILKKVLNAAVNSAQPQQDSEVTDDVFDEIQDADITAEEVKAAMTSKERKGCRA